MLFFSLKLFFANGGADCYIVSVGNYAQTPKKADFNGERLERKSNKTIQKGIATLEAQPEPSILVIPDAVLLGAAECSALQQEMLLHCSKMGNRFAILDVFMDEDAPISPEIVKDFRHAIGSNNLGWGAAYYPWVQTNISGLDAVGLSHIDKNAIDNLISLLSKEVDERMKAGLNTNQGTDLKIEINALKTLKNKTEDPAKIDPSIVDNLHQTFSAVSPLYKDLMKSLCEKLNLLPPSGGIAGIYVLVDSQKGVFNAPANVRLNAVVEPLVQVTQDEQQDLNLPLDGKSVNAIRTFPGMGVLIWGARTLDGNSLDWRYVSVRRTAIFIEQSIKLALEAYTFSPNTASTWAQIQAEINQFLTNFWLSGGLAGATASDAFCVDIGLGVTMTPLDILEGRMRLSVKIAISRPAEFLEITFQKKMQGI